MIGDSVFDEEAAKAIDIEFLGVTYGYGFTKDDRYILKKTADSPRDILKNM
jgi:phosphoglycolate phosphatase-like HAD superfamily hydrolase